MKKFLYCALALALLAVGCKNRNREADTPLDVHAALSDSVAIQKAAQALPEEPVMDIVTSMGTIKVRLFKDTPRHRDNFVKLALSGYFDNQVFHRVIDSFMIQGGDPLSRDTLYIDTKSVSHSLLSICKAVESLSPRYKGHLGSRFLYAIHVTIKTALLEPKVHIEWRNGYIRRES